MIIGIPRERRPHEYRVGLPPSGVGLFLQNEHAVFVEHGAGVGAGFSDDDYAQAGAIIVYSDEEVYRRADLVLKFARPLREELEMMRPDQALMGFQYLAAARQDKLVLFQEKQLTAIAYEQIEEGDGYRPVLAPNSQLGGHMAVQVAARLMQNDFGGRGILLAGLVGVPAPEVVIIGAGMAGGTAALTFAALGAHVTALDIDLRKLQELKSRTSCHLVTMLATPYNIRRACSYADVLIGAVYVPGERAPIVVTRDMVSRMKRRSVIIDMAIDTGGCVETSRPTSHGSPTYVEEGVIHCCVPNMPGVLGRSGSYTLFNAAFRYLTAISRLGVDRAIESLPALERGLNTYRGKVRHLKRLLDVGSDEG
ncbi:MAG: alanine dehydrogenase [Chloroflexota bacterium]